MEKLSSTLRNMLLSLTGICIIVSGILALVNKVTKAPIEEAQVKAKVEAISAVTPKFDNNPFAERLRFLPEGESDSLTVYPAKKGGRLPRRLCCGELHAGGLQRPDLRDGGLRCLGQARRLLCPTARRESWAWVTDPRVVPPEEPDGWYPRHARTRHEGRIAPLCLQGRR